MSVIFEYHRINNPVKHYYTVYLLSSQHHGHHALWLSGLGALIDQDGAELHLGQAGVSSPDTGAADHISVLEKNEEKNYR